MSSVEFDLAKIRVTIDVTLQANGEDHDYLAQRMNSALFGAINANSNELLTKDSDAKVTKHGLFFKTSLLSPEAANLTEQDVQQWIIRQINDPLLQPNDLPALLSHYALSDPAEIRQEIADSILQDSQKNTNSEPVDKNDFSEKSYALSHTFEGGLNGRFDEGIFKGFDPRWMSGCQAIIGFDKNDNAIIPLEEMTHYVSKMSDDIQDMLLEYMGSTHATMISPILQKSIYSLIDLKVRSQILANSSSEKENSLFSPKKTSYPRPSSR